MDTSHFISLFENATEGIIVTGTEANIRMANPSACLMFGYAKEELIGNKIEMLLPAQFRNAHVELRNDFYKNPHNRVMGHGRDLLGEKKDGKKFPVEVSLSTYLHNDERFVIAFIINITSRKQIEENMLQQKNELERMTNEMRKLNTDLEDKVEERTVILKEALQRLQQSQDELSEALNKEKLLNEMKSRFVSMASHEFRTPLSTVLSSASLLSKYTASEEQEKRNKHIEKIKGSVKQLNDLLEDFLSLGKLDEGKMLIGIKEFNLTDTIHDTIEELKTLSKDGQRFHYVHKGEEIIEADNKMLRNILINLVSNAIKFSHENATININSLVKNKLVTLKVADEGIGISEEDQQLLFTSFFRGKNVLNIQGTGLGLHIVKRYLNLMGGTVTVKSRLGKGTTVTCSFPV